MRYRFFPFLLCAAACQGSSHELGGFLVELDESSLSISHGQHGDVLHELSIASGSGTAEVEMAFGSFRFDEESSQLRAAAEWKPRVATPDGLALDARDADGALLGSLSLAVVSDDVLELRWAPVDLASNRVALSAACDEDDHFMGLGAHAQDVDHVGQAFPLWVSEPGVGKTTDEEQPSDWSLTGTRHASSYPVPFLLRPHQPHGLLVDTSARLEADLCASDSERFSLTSWTGAARWLLISGEGPLQVVEELTAHTGRVQLPPPWALGVWNDAVHGSEEVRAAAELLRDQGASVSAIWSEDWKGGEWGSTGYHLTNEWFLDEETYPDGAELAAELEADGFKWLGYFSAFLAEDTQTWSSAEAAGVLLRDEEGEPCTFLGVTLNQTTLVDYSDPGAQDWSVGWMETALDLGFDGWMADYGEWLPLDCALASGADPWLEHNLYPQRWQQANLAAIQGRDATFFSRSGWAGTAGLSPVVWGGDQRTSFDSDDGFPTVLALGLGLAASGVPIYTHDIAGYQSVGNEPSDKELWFRWAALGAYSPVMRNHHGAFADDNWQYDSDEETLAYWVALTQEHARLHPYRYALAAQAASQGTPMVLPVSFVFPQEGDWDRMDAWMLGSSMLVAPVLEAGVSGRDVTLPSGIEWYDWHSRKLASTGWQDAELDQIPVFVASGSTIPTLMEVPDSLVEGSLTGLTTLSDADAGRVVYLFGGGGDFDEADGTRYRVSGTPTGTSEELVTLTAGEATVAGVTLSIDGPREREYWLVVVE